MAQGFPGLWSGWQAAGQAGDERRANEARMASQAARDQMEQVKLMAEQVAAVQKDAVTTLQTAVQAAMEQAAATGQPVNWEGLTKLRQTLVDGVLPTVQQAQEAGIPTANATLFLQQVDNAYRQTSPGAKSTLAANKAYETAAAQASGTVAPNVQAGRATMAGMEQKAKQDVQYSPEATAAKARREQAVSAARARGTATVPSLPQGMVLGADGAAQFVPGFLEGVKEKAGMESPPDQKPYVAVNAETQEMIAARFDPATGQFLTGDGRPLPAGFLPVSVPGVQAANVGDAASMTPRAKGELETQLIALDDQIATASNVLTKFDPKALELPGRIETALLGGADYLGLNLTPDQEKTLKDRTAFLQDSYTQLNETIKAITGAAMTNAEAERIRKQMPDPEKMGPVKFQEAARGVLKKLKLAQMRKRWMLKNGMAADFGAEGFTPQISIDNFERTYRTRIEEVMGERSVTAPEAKRMVDEEWFGAPQ